MDAVLATIVAIRQALIQLNIRLIKIYIDFYINLMNQTKSFNSGLRLNMRKASCPSGGMVSSNPHHWRGKRRHHHGGGVCWLFMLLWIDCDVTSSLYVKNGTKITLRSGYVG
jgi:hypothetical protein